MFHKMMVLVLLVFSTNLFAGNEVGNGGIGFWCADSKSYLLLDFYEHDLLNSENKIIVSNEENFGKILNERLQILEKLDARNFKIYSNGAKGIIEKTNFLEGIKLNSTKDSLEVAQPKGCIRKQFALQRKNGAVTDFYFDKDIWKELSPLQKAGLVLHEVIYDQFSYFNELNSIKVRKMTALIMSKKFETMSDSEYKNFIKDLRLPIY